MFGIATEEQWEKMKKFIKSDKYKKEDFFVFETMATGDREIPNRYQKINKSALEVMEQDAKKGVSLMLNHNEGQFGVQAIPIGKVFDARMSIGTQDGEQNALYLTQYILRDDSKVDGYSKNDIINLIESGIAEDTSVCFSIPYETCECNICHKPFYGGECRHYKGCNYVVNEETGETRTCVMEINAPNYSSMQHNGNAMLIENSVVFDGAYPNAMIQQSANGYNILQNDSEKEEKAVLGKEQVIVGYATTNDMKLMYKPSMKGGSLMDEEKEKLSTEVNEEAVEVEEVTDEVTEETTEEENEQADEQAEEVANEEVEETVEEQMSISKNEIVEAFGKEEITKEEVLRYAKEGMAYRTSVIEDTLKSGIKSMGNDFNVEAFKKSFEMMSTEDIIKNKETFDKQVTEKFGTARVSKDTVDTEEHKITPDIDLSIMKTMKY